MSSATCKRCGSIYAPADGDICGMCEAQYELYPTAAAEHDDLVRRIAARLNPLSNDEKARKIDQLWGNPPRGGFTRR
jgi:hypothetical protein